MKIMGMNSIEAEHTYEFHGFPVRGPEKRALQKRFKNHPDLLCFPF
jgi:hypothetical protein